jgi:hypothetical protein
MKKLITLLFIAVSLSTFSTSVTFKVSMKGSEMECDSVFIVGEQTSWAFVQMTAEGDSIFSTTMNLTEGDSAAYYFITIGYWASDYLDYREIVPEECDFSAELAGWTGDRGLVVPATTTTISYVWGTCDDISASTAIQTTADFENIELFPNPGNGIFTLNIPGLNSMASIDIMDISGKNLKSLKTAINSFSIDLSDISEGLYFVKVSEGDKSTVKKLVIK